MRILVCSKSLPVGRHPEVSGSTASRAVWRLAVTREGLPTLVRPRRRPAGEGPAGWLPLALCPGSQDGCSGQCRLQAQCQGFRAKGCERALTEKRHGFEKRPYKAPSCEHCDHRIMSPQGARRESLTRLLVPRAGPATVFRAFAPNFAEKLFSVTLATYVQSSRPTPGVDGSKETARGTRRGHCPPRACGVERQGR